MRATADLTAPATARSSRSNRLLLSDTLTSQSKYLMIMGMHLVNDKQQEHKNIEESVHRSTFYLDFTRTMATSAMLFRAFPSIHPGTSTSTTHWVRLRFWVHLTPDTAQHELGSPNPTRSNGRIS